MSALRTPEEERLDGITPPSPCECGCGAITNERQREAQRLRANGWKNVQIAEHWNMAPGSVKALLYRAPSRYLRGHSAAALRGENVYEQHCERCGSSMFRATPTRFCGSWSCQSEGRRLAQIRRQQSRVETRRMVLADLIVRQARDAQSYRVGHRSVLYLDEVRDGFKRSTHELVSHSGEWDDPTADAAIARLEIQAGWDRRELAFLNARPRHPRSLLGYDTPNPRAGLGLFEHARGAP